MTPEFSIIVPIVDAATTVDELRSRLDAQTVARDDFEVLFEPVTARAHLGIADALDHALRAARGRTVVFLGEAARPEPDWLAAYRRAFAASGCDVLAGGHAREEQRSADARLELGLRALCKRRPQSVACAFAFRTANAAVRREAIDRTSGFNPCLGAIGDVELGIRLWETGARFGFADGAAAGPTTAPMTSFDEVSTLFWRHPYGVVLLVAAWLRDVERGDTTPLAQLCPSELAADHALLDPLRELDRACDRRLPVTWTSRARLVDYLAKRFPALMTATEAAAYVNQAIESGLLQRRTVADVELDGRLLENWIHDCRPPFQRSQLRLGLGHDKRTPFLRSGSPRDLLTLRCRGRYEVTIDAEALGDRTARIHIPLPIARAHQRDVEITECEPAWLRDHLDRDHGMLVDVPYRAGPTERVTCAYEFRCLIDEVPPLTARPRGEQTEPHESLLQPAILRRARERAERLLDQLALDRNSDPVEAVRAIYGWIQSTITLAMVPPIPRYHHNALEVGSADCFGQMFLFVNLCRMVGVPAQLRFGAYFNELFDPSLDHNAVELFGAGSSPMSHVWAEFYIRDRGWFPVEIQGGGKRRINACNVEDARLRPAIRDAITSYEHELLGYMSPSRIYASDRLFDWPTYARFGDDSDPASTRLQQATGHRLMLTLDR